MLVAIVLFGFVPLVGMPLAAIAAPVTPPILASLFSFSGERPTRLGLDHGLLAPCPTTPNCVSSQSQDSQHQIAPLTYTGSPAAAIQQLKTLISELPRTEIIQATDHYLYAEFTSALMGFVDDVEFYVEPENHQIQVRSASRLGESDLGVNRKRVEAIRAKLDVQ